MRDEPGSAATVPSWFVTFADMMMLLLTFFVMLVSLSELKSEEKYQVLMDSFQQQFGYGGGNLDKGPGDLRPRNSTLTKLATQARWKRSQLLQPSSKVQAPPGDSEKVNSGRAAPQTATGTVLYFQRKPSELDQHSGEVLGPRSNPATPGT